MTAALLWFAAGCGAFTVACLLTLLHQANETNRKLKLELVERKFGVSVSIATFRGGPWDGQEIRIECRHPDFTLPQEMVYRRRVYRLEHDSPSAYYVVQESKTVEVS